MQDWLELGEANICLSKLGLPRHSTAEKGWDLFNLYNLVGSYPRDRYIFDLGCGELHALKLLYALGFSNLYGVDLSITLQHRLSQLSRMWRNKTLKVPFHLKKMDLTRTSFPEGMFDLAVCLSTIEHGVDMNKFFVEVGRILKFGGLLLITTDYWEEKIQMSNDFRTYGLPWMVFDRKDILKIITTAEENGFSLLDEGKCDLDCKDKCVVWGGCEYTFLCAIFKKSYLLL